jgi:hypothetical protein
MKIPKELIVETGYRSRLPTAKPFRIAPRAADDVDEPAAPTASAPYEPEAVAHAAVPCPVSPADTLVARLDAANTEAERTALLAAASTEARRGAQGTHAYRAMISAAQASVAAADALEASLKAAPDEAARVAILSVAPEALRIELVERMRQPSARERYMTMILGW